MNDKLIKHPGNIAPLCGIINSEIKKNSPFHEVFKLLKYFFDKGMEFFRILRRKIAESDS